MAEIYTEGGVTVGNGSNGTNYVYPYPPMYGYGNNNGGFFNSDAVWAIILFAMIFGWGGNGNGFGGGFMGGNNMLYDINANTNRGFDQASIISGINGIQGSLSDAAVARCNNTTTLLQAVNGLGSQFANCCCENKLAVADLKYTVATENCADRQAISDGLRDVIANNTANTNAILSKLSQQELESKNDQIALLRTQLNMQTLAASQANQTNDLVNALRPCPIPAYLSCSPYQSYNFNPNGCGCSSIQ